MNQQFIPGMRIEIRDAEWRIQRVDRASDGGYLLSCVGLSELVRGRSAQFLSKLENNPEKNACLFSARHDQNIALDWEDVQTRPADSKMFKTYTDSTQAARPLERTIEYLAPFIKPDRATDYAIAWEVFADVASDS
jgi:hypothetical protein